MCPRNFLDTAGSTLTQVATAFALSIFSTLLLHSYQRIVQAVVSAVSVAAVGPAGQVEIADSLEHGKSIVGILLEQGISAVTSQPAEAKPVEAKAGNQQDTTAATKTEAKPSVSLAKQKKHKVVDRRRTRRRGGGNQETPSHDEEEEDSGSDSDLDGGSIGGSSDDGSLSVLSEDLGEDDLELLDSLSDSSSSEPEDERDEDPVQGDIEAVGATSTAVSATGLLPNPVKRARKRHIVLAANFTMPPSSPHKLKPGTSHEGVKGQTGLPYPLWPPKGLLDSKSDSQLDELVKSTQVQASVYTACSLVAEESSLMALRVFVYWLQSYPIIIATCTQVRASVWKQCIHLEAFNAVMYILLPRVQPLCGHGLRPSSISFPRSRRL